MGSKIVEQKFRDEAIMPEDSGMGQYIEYDIELCAKLGEA